MPELHLNYSYVPTDYCVEGLQRYFENHIKPGDFLTGLLENDFMKIMTHCDAINRNRLTDWAQWLHNEPSMKSWGSKEAVREWLSGAHHGTDNVEFLQSLRDAQGHSGSSDAGSVSAERS
jgi:hypothetical protein